MSVSDRERAIESIYMTVAAPETWPVALQHIADITNDVGAVLLFERNDGKFGHTVSKSLEALFEDFSANYPGDDFRAMRGRERDLLFRQDAVTDIDVVSAEEMNAHPFYQMLARHDLKYFAAAPLQPAPDFICAIAVQRAIDRQPFTPSEI